MRGTQRQHEKAEKETYKELQKLPYTWKVKFKCLPCHESLSNEGRYCSVCPNYPPLSCLTCLWFFSLELPNVSPNDPFFIHKGNGPPPPPPPEVDAFWDGTHATSPDAIWQPRGAWMHLDLVGMLEMVNLIWRDNVDIVCCQNKTCRRCREHSHQAELQ